MTKRLRRRVKEREKRHHRRGGIRRWRAARSRPVFGWVRVRIPVELSIMHYVHRMAVVRACAAIREGLIRDRRDVILDFSNTRRIKSEGMLLIVAEVDRALRMCGPDRQVQCKMPEGADPQATIVREVLEQIGLLKIIGHTTHASTRGDKEFDESVRHWRYATGTRVDEEPGDVLEKHEGRISPSLMKGMQIGLAEALLNSVHHAYRAPRGDGCPVRGERRWWMFTNERDGMLNVLVCDLGIGIPRALPLKWGKDILKRVAMMFSGVPPQVAAIKMALVVGQSGTGETNRGNGLPQVWNATAESNAGGVGISSARAYVGLDPVTGKRTETQFETDILGTLVSWSVPVEARDEAE